ncbi:Uncharacterized protein ALO61_02594 [Pseudomonas savastanoi pv. nerii]|uniref:DUF7079 domain-containing protein n=4 Tax=Pseudomonas syringae group genomosp. 2 TaxID=251698 RepID=A0A0N8REH4_PSEA0|nr:hypothetical protein ALO70_200084 [Pseudomonas amygdali pv. eriobotryae]KPY10194.1 Uncharacterized protein ALO61_02594 [Pseudomonas savastanoi pv. nerii]KPY50885.1 Uncharacterized protein ALO49_03726 [Pseudomonas savastanoi pv. retacarpa]KPY79077.1 Uncharacterized protein ALO58_02085 [Pseudomonas savastanoi pv. savastanoi]RML93646.1 hypothetical protein ALQ88_03185 [Pseudomonas savastanoi]RMR67311.1 hypothetical protein ALP82_02888 [Pseudomonas savastanoi pv. fraxini]
MDSYRSRGLMNAVDSNRLKVWQALSQFFLGTEVYQATYDQVVKSIGESDYNPAQVQ